MVMLTYKSIKDIDEHVRAKEKKYRRDFVIKSLSDKIERMSNIKKFYSCSGDDILKIA